MFEFSIAMNYLIPRWRQLSVSIISLISVVVISLVVWLILIFFSVTEGLEKSWIQKLISLTAPIRITPTDHYYNSYYYLADTISQKSDYTPKSLGEKRSALETDPLDSSVDQLPPPEWPLPDLDRLGELIDPVKRAFSIIEKLKLKGSDFEVSQGSLSLTRPGFPPFNTGTYLGSIDQENTSLKNTLIPPSIEDINHCIFTLKNPWFLEKISVHSLKTNEFWKIPKTLVPDEGTYYAMGCFEDSELLQVIFPQNAKSLHSLSETIKTFTQLKPVTLKVTSEDSFFLIDKKRVEIGSTPLLFAKDTPLILTKPLQSFDSVSVVVKIQEGEWRGEVPLKELSLKEASMNKELNFEPHPVFGEPILLPKSFKEQKIFLGDKGSLSYYSPTTTSIQEQKVPVFVLGFYDPGIIPIGGKFVLANGSLVSLFSLSQNEGQRIKTNGIHVRFDDLKQAAGLKEKLLKQFEKAEITRYFKIETFEEFEFTKDLIQQLKSERNLFTLIASVIIIVACSNIISMLIILVNDKKLEIGILRSLGATSFHIATIFGICGVVMGALGSFIGVVAASFTLKNLNQLIAFLSRLQGFDLLNPVFYGDTLPKEMSMEALSFVVTCTVLLSLLAGIIPAFKASALKPSTILKAE
jgi:lipoprotein-releasing system permease protein